MRRRVVFRRDAVRRVGVVVRGVGVVVRRAAPRQLVVEEDVVRVVAGVVPARVHRRVRRRAAGVRDTVIVRRGRNGRSRGGRDRAPGERGGRRRRRRGRGGRGARRGRARAGGGRRRRVLPRGVSGRLRVRARGRHDAETDDDAGPRGANAGCQRGEKPRAVNERDAERASLEKYRRARDADAKVRKRARAKGRAPPRSPARRGSARPRTNASGSAKDVSVTRRAGSGEVRL